MTETQLSAAIRGALEANGFWVIRMQSRGRSSSRAVASGEPGIPDLLVVGLGWLEVKAATGELSRIQREWHKRARGAGERVAVVRDVREALGVALQWRSEMT